MMLGIELIASQRVGKLFSATFFGMSLVVLVVGGRRYFEN